SLAHGFPWSLPPLHRIGWPSPRGRIAVGVGLGGGAPEGAAAAVPSRTATATPVACKDGNCRRVRPLTRKSYKRSATRNLALAARGLSAISASLARNGFLVKM